MDEAGLDVLIATSRHNVQYLLGGYRFFFFDVMEAIGTSRYLPGVRLSKGLSGKPDLHRQPHGEVRARSRTDMGAAGQDGRWGTIDAMDLAIDHVRKLGAAAKRVGYRGRASCRPMRGIICVPGSTVSNCAKPISPSSGFAPSNLPPNSI